MTEQAKMALEEHLPRLGMALTGALFVALKTSRHYRPGHAAVEAPLAQLLRLIRELHRQNEDASVVLKGGQLYLADLRLKTGGGGFAAAQAVREQMERQRVGRLSFRPGVSITELRRFVYGFAAEGAPASDPYAELLGWLQRHEVARVEVETVREEAVRLVEAETARLPDQRFRVRGAYGRVASTIAAVFADAREGNRLRLRDCKRVVQQLIDLLPQHESSLLGLSTGRRRGELEEHAAAVTVISLAMGRRLGMSKLHLCDLGMSALLHDLGKADVPSWILEKREPLSVQERRALEGHTLHGVRKMLQLRGVDAGSAPIISAIFEHHLAAPASAPAGSGGRSPGLSSRIIAVADSYDTLTSSRAFSRVPCRPDLALRFLLSQKSGHDPALVKLLVDCVGSPGIGSMLLLAGGETVVVLEQRATLLVKVVADAAGREVDGPVRELPLSSRCIPVDRHAYGIDVSRYF